MPQKTFSVSDVKRSQEEARPVGRGVRHDIKRISY